MFLLRVCHKGCVLAFRGCLDNAVQRSSDENGTVVPGISVQLTTGKVTFPVSQLCAYTYLMPTRKKTLYLTACISVGN